MKNGRKILCQLQLKENMDSSKAKGNFYNVSFPFPLFY